MVVLWYNYIRKNNGDNTMNKKEKTITLLIKVIGLILFGMIINLFVHELSHLLILIFVNGEPIKMSFGEESFVGGYVEQK